MDHGSPNPKFSFCSRSSIANDSNWLECLPWTVAMFTSARWIPGYVSNSSVSIQLNYSPNANTMSFIGSIAYQSLWRPWGSDVPMSDGSLSLEVLSHALDLFNLSLERTHRSTFIRTTLAQLVDQIHWQSNNNFEAVHCCATYIYLWISSFSSTRCCCSCPFVQFFCATIWSYFRKGLFWRMSASFLSLHHHLIAMYTYMHASTHTPWYACIGVNPGGSGCHDLPRSTWIRSGSRGGRRGIVGWSWGVPRNKWLKERSLKIATRTHDAIPSFETRLTPPYV